MARLPTPGNDPETWGEILNEYLSVGHAEDGHHRMGLVVTEFGVDNTGVADAAADINAVIAASNPGDAIVFPGGEYAIEEPILLLADRNYVGLGNPTLRRKDNTAMTAVVMVDPVAPTPVNNMLVSGITVDGNSANNATFPTTGSPSPIFANITSTGNITGWYASGLCTVAYDAAVFRTLAGSCRITATGSSSVACTTTVLSGQAIPAVPGRTYTWTAYARAGTTGRLATAAIQWYNSTTLISTSNGTAVTDTNAGWTQVTVTAVCPPGVDQFAVRVTFAGAVNTEVHYVDDGEITHTLVGGDNFTLRGVSDSVFDNVTSLSACKNGIYFYGDGADAYGNRITRSEVRNAALAGIFFASDTNDNQIDGSVITGCLTGAEISGSRTSLTGSVLYQHGGSGVLVYGGQCVVSACRIMLNGRFGVYVGPYGDYVSISNNEIYANSIESSGAYAAIFLAGYLVPRDVLYPHIMGNVVVSNVPAYTTGGQHALAVSLGDHTGAVVNGNSAQLNAADGLPAASLQVTGLKAGDVFNGVAWTDNLHARYGYPPGTVLATMRQTALQSTANAGAATAITFTTEDRDLLNAHDNVTNPSRWTCPIGGWYMLTGAVGWALDVTGNYRGVFWRVNGTAIDGSYVVGPPNGVQPTVVSARPTPVLLTAGQYVELCVYHNGTGAIDTTVALGGHQSRMTITAA